METALFHDVTKTKPSHHRAPASAGPVEEPGPSTAQGRALSKEIDESLAPAPTKEKLLREILEYETTHGRCTKTFVKKIRKQLRSYAPAQ